MANKQVKVGSKNDVVIYGEYFPGAGIDITEEGDANVEILCDSGVIFGTEEDYDRRMALLAFTKLEASR